MKIWLRTAILITNSKRFWSRNLAGFRIEQTFAEVTPRRVRSLQKRRPREVREGTEQAEGAGVEMVRSTSRRTQERRLVPGGRPGE